MSVLVNLVNLSTMSIKEAEKDNKSPSFEMTWGSSTSSGYCSESDSDSEFEQYFTARTSFIRKPTKPVKEKKVR